MTVSWHENIFHILLHSPHKRPVTVWFHIKAVNFFTNIHKRHPIAHPLGRGMGCLLWTQHQIDILPQFLYGMRYITTLDGMWSFDVCFYRKPWSSCWTNSHVVSDLRCHDTQMTSMWYSKSKQNVLQWASKECPRIYTHVSHLMVFCVVWHRSVLPIPFRVISLILAILTMQLPLKYQ